MEMRFISPTLVRLPDGGRHVRDFLTYKDRSVDFQLRKAKKNFRWAGSDPEGYAEHLANLQSQLNACLLMEDEDGNPVTYSGLWKDLENRFGWETVHSIGVPDHGIGVPFAKVPPPMRPYQREAVKALLHARHGAVALPTGSGKSLIIQNVLQQLSRRSVVVAPLGAVARQLYEGLREAFGQKYVGMYGDGRKDLGKMITVAVAQSLVRTEEGTPAWDFFSGAEVLVWDEAHTTPAATFEKVCLNMLSSAPCRFFLSATHARSDGGEMLLRGITGPIVYSKSYQELVKEGYLAQLRFKTFEVSSYGRTGARDPKTETRRQFYCNPNVNAMAADLAHKFVTLSGKQVLILVEEFDQFVQLANFMKVPFEFAHGGVTKESKKKVPEQYWQCDVDKSVEDFNSGKLRCFIGTSAVSTGVDIKPVDCIIYLQAGASEVKVKQAIGRGTRLVPGKTECWVIDFLVKDSQTMENQLKARNKIYRTFQE